MPTLGCTWSVNHDLHDDAQNVCALTIILLIVNTVLNLDIYRPWGSLLWTCCSDSRLGRKLNRKVKSCPVVWGLQFCWSNGHEDHLSCIFRYIEYLGNAGQPLEERCCWKEVQVHYLQSSDQWLLIKNNILFQSVKTDILYIIMIANLKDQTLAS